MPTREAPGEERLRRHLVGGVEHRRRQLAGPARVMGQAQAGKGFEVGGSNSGSPPPSSRWPRTGW